VVRLLEDLGRDTGKRRQVVRVVGRDREYSAIGPGADEHVLAPGRVAPAHDHAVVRQAVEHRAPERRVPVVEEDRTGEDRVVAQLVREGLELLEGHLRVQPAAVVLHDPGLVATAQVDPLREASQDRLRLERGVDHDRVLDAGQRGRRIQRIVRTGVEQVAAEP